MYLCCDSPLFGLVYYRLWPLYYKYPVVAIVGLQPCLHSYIAIHCLPLNFCLTWAATPSSEPFNPWTTDPPLHPQLLNSCWASQDPARSWHKTRLSITLFQPHTPWTTASRNTMANLETLTCIFHEEDPVPAPRRSSDDLPHHVKGISHWYAEAKPTAGYYIPKKYSPTKEFEPIEFLNNQWYGLFKDESIPDTLCTHAIAAIPIKNNLGLRDWDISELQHPYYMPNPDTHHHQPTWGQQCVQLEHHHNPCNISHH